MQLNIHLLKMSELRVYFLRYNVLNALNPQQVVDVLYFIQFSKGSLLHMAFIFLHLAKNNIIRAKNWLSFGKCCFCATVSKSFVKADFKSVTQKSPIWNEMV